MRNANILILMHFHSVYIPGNLVQPGSSQSSFYTSKSRAIHTFTIHPFKFEYIIYLYFLIRYIVNILLMLVSFDFIVDGLSR